MSDDFPPGRPDFEPPAATWGRPVPGPDQTRPVPVEQPAGQQITTPPGPWSAPFVPGWQPAYGQPSYSAPAYAPPPPVPRPPAFPTRPEPAVLPPGPYKQPWPPPTPSPAREGKGSFGLGVAISVITLGIAWWITTTVADDSAPTALANAALTVSTVLLIAAGIVLVLIPRTLRTGAGILIGFIAAMLAAGAVWVLLVLSFVT